MHMTNFMIGREVETFGFINKQVDNILNVHSDFHKNHTAKMMYAQVECYQRLVKVLLEKRNIDKI